MTLVRYGPDNPHPFSQIRTELIWEGKYDEYGNRREVDIAGASMPLQKIETVDEPRSRAEVQGLLFEPQKSHRDDFRNRLIWGDNKLVMASLLKEFKGQVDLIYIDPPFDVGADFTMNLSIGDGNEKIDKDQSTLELVAYRDMWGRGTDSYLSMLHERLSIMRELLSETGQIYVHCDWRTNSLIRLILDEVFGINNFLSELTWRKLTAAKSQSDFFSNVKDSIIVYRKFKSKFNPQFITGKKDDKNYPYIEKHTGRRYGSFDFTQTGQGPSRIFGDKLLAPPAGKHWIWKQESIDEGLRDGTIIFTSKGLPRVKRYFDEKEGNYLGDLWVDEEVSPLSANSSERLDYPTQKPESLLERIIKASSNEGDLVADFFCGSGTTGAVAEKLGRRWIMADLGRFAIHTSRKRLIEVQRALHAEHQPYRSFDVYNLGRYERQWWQKESLKGADEEHRRVVLEFYRAEPLTNPPSPLLHARKAGAYVHVDKIDSVFTRLDARAVALAVQQVGGRELNCLAWEFEMDLRMVCDALEQELGVKIKLIPIPREIMERNRKEVPPFLEVATLSAQPVYQTIDKERVVDIKLTQFLPSLTEVPSKELEALRERAVTSGFDFIDFWAIDFDYQPGEPFNHHWQAFRTRRDRSLPTVSDLHYTYTQPGKHTACVKVVDVFGVDTSITVDIVI